jgi:streptogramin lyase
MWFTEQRENKIGRIALSGSPITEFAIPTPNSEPIGIALGPDGNLWFAESKGNKIGRITPAGAITEWPLPPKSNPTHIAAGPDGNVWFTENAEIEEEVGEGTERHKLPPKPAGRIGRISPFGVVNEWPLPRAAGEEALPGGITAGPDGNVWFTDERQGSIGRITPAGVISEFHVTGGGGPHGITDGPNGELWFTLVWGNKIGRIPPSGSPITLTQIPTANSQPNEIALGPDGALWFTENGNHKVLIGPKEEEREFSRIGRITPGEVINEYPTEIPESGPAGIAPGADGNLWFTESNRNNIARIGAGVLEPLLGSLSVSGNHEALTPQTCAGTWASWAGLQPSAGLFGFDGYVWLVNGAPVAVGPSPVYTPTMANVGYQLSCAATLTYPLLDVTTSAASAPVAVIPPPPTLSAVKQSAAKWREGNKSATISAKGAKRHGRKHRKHKPPVGTTFTFSLNELAAVTVTFTHVASGRELGHKCVAKTRHNRKRRHCPLTVTDGRLSFTGHEGVDHVRFEGRVSARAKLKPGPYMVTIAAANSTGPSAPSSLGFTIVK